MQHEDPKRRSRWILRVMEWDEPKAKYPNIWYAGMPCHLLLLNRVASRLRIGDLIAVYYPQSTQHTERSEKFVGLARVSAIRGARQPDFFWVDVETAHVLKKPLASDAPQRVFMCCDTGWPEQEVALFQRVFDAAVAEGWSPQSDDLDPAVGKPARVDDSGKADKPSKPSSSPSPKVAEKSARSTPPKADTATPKKVSSKPAANAKPKVRGLNPAKGERVFAGADYSGDMRDAKERTWTAVIGLAKDRLRVLRLNPTGRAGVQAALKDPKGSLLGAEAVGLGFPFALPQPFAVSLLEGETQDDAWKAVVAKLQQLPRPAFLAAVHEFLEANGEALRKTDELAQAESPLHRGKHDFSARAYHGMRMLAEERSRYAVRPFDALPSQGGRVVLEVHPGASARMLQPDTGSGKNRDALIERLTSLETLPLAMDAAFANSCRNSVSALGAVLAARSAAVATVTDEIQKTPEELQPGQGDRILSEGWIYGLTEPTQG